MAAKVVLNLLSNAFKFTLAGRIDLSLGRVGAAVELAVRDTGEGIPAGQMPKLFERFHQIKGSSGRTQEGLGIGLALVRKLVRLHGGDVRAESVHGQGSIFTASLPLGKAHLPADQIEAPRILTSTAVGSAPYVEEALRGRQPPAGLAANDRESPLLPQGGVGLETLAPPSGPRILLADDNADMREYVRRLLSEQYDVTAVGNGRETLDTALREQPDLVLTDVMMPGLDGFGLLRALRADPRSAEVLVVLLPARAGEEARVDGLEAGADDYLTNPFNSRELLARVQAHLELAGMRRKTSAAVLRASQERLQVALAASDTGTFRWEPSTGRFLDLDENLKGLLGLAPGEAVRVTGDLLARVHPDDVPELASALDRCRRGADLDTEHRVVLPVGCVRWLHDRGKLERASAGRPAYVVGACTDITQRKRAEEALRESERQFRTLADSIPQLTWMTSPDGYILWYNRRWYEYTGTTPEQVEGWGWQSVHDPAELPRVLASWRAALANGEPWEDTFPLRRHDGQMRWHLSRAVPVRDEQGRIARWFGTNTDISDRIEIERALKEAGRRKDEFLGMLAHELRNPLAPIRTGLQVLKVSSGVGQAFEQTRAMMERQVTHLSRIVDDLLDVARITRGKLDLKPERLDLGRLVRVTTGDHRSAFEQAGLALHAEVPETPVWVTGDPTRLTQVLENLLQNAAKFTERGGRVGVGVEADRDRRQAVLTVWDTGGGLEPDMLPRLFEAFAQADRSLDRSKGGLGLGLAMVKGLAELHGGQVRAASGGLGKGAEFTVTLPLEPEPATLSGMPVSTPRAKKRLRILVVEDNRDAADSLRMLLELYGYEVTVAYTGPEGVEAAAALRPDVVLCDIGLPGLDGYGVVSALRRDPATATARMIAVTGYGGDEDRLRTQEAGFDQHLTKPVDPEALVTVLSH